MQWRRLDQRPPAVQPAGLLSLAVSPMGASMSLTKTANVAQASLPELWYASESPPGNATLSDLHASSRRTWRFRRDHPE